MNQVKMGEIYMNNQGNMNCSKCKFFNRKKVISHKYFGVCENQKSFYHKMIKSVNESCENIKPGKFTKSCIIFLNR